ncbi:transcriptional regulator [Flavobacterium magnum]|uniref:Transcriptional regulator n=1 Tax=Flavobacterium magnum TaxID=2162713 RepID=A0A2S0REM9_9FLAO|nr:BlaI/MecI/CopY family transcriptional regulator [Flavobacterium magnum]AWA30094.1 transcriptional regulator [Flavobacterium magnum]
MENRKEIMQSEPTKSELEILQVLWQFGPSTVRFVNDTLNEQKRSVQYTSTLKLMQIMAEKGMLNPDKSSMKHIYSAAVEEKKTKGLLLEKFVDNLYQGSSSSLMTQLLGNKRTTQQELDEIRAMLDKIDKKK